MGCDGNLGATRNWCSLNASLKRSHAITGGLKLFRALSVMLIWRYGLACAQHNSLQLYVFPLLLAYLYLYETTVTEIAPC